LRVLLFPTCLPDLFFPSAVRAASRVLARVGCTVEFRKGAVCCGQPAWNSGHVADARRVAVGAMRALHGTEPIVSCSGSCATMMHEYWPELFDGTAHAAQAADVAARVREFSSFVADEVGADRLPPARLRPTVAAYHDSCHMLRMLGISDAPRRLLSRIEGLEVRALHAQARCCGFGGTFSVRYPELSAAMADEKVDDARDREVDVLVASDLGCLMQICGRAEARGVPLTGRYIAEVLDDALTMAAA
jgi:L-lactate dehydrogenase complex protein LldE